MSTKGRVSPNVYPGVVTMTTKSASGGTQRAWDAPWLPLSLLGAFHRHSASSGDKHYCHVNGGEMRIREGRGPSSHSQGEAQLGLCQVSLASGRFPSWILQGECLNQLGLPPQTGSSAAEAQAWIPIGHTSPLLRHCQAGPP